MEKRARKFQEPREPSDADWQWNRMVLRFMMAMTHAMQQSVLNHLCVRGPQEELYRRMVSDLPRLTTHELRQMQKHIKQNLECREVEGLEEHQWDAQRPWSREVTPEDAASTNTTGFILVHDETELNSPVVERCHCGLETVTLETRKEGRNHGRLFKRCPNWRDVAHRCNFFMWLEEQPNWRPTQNHEAWAQGTPTSTTMSPTPRTPPTKASPTAKGSQTTTAKQPGTKSPSSSSMPPTPKMPSRGQESSQDNCLHQFTCHAGSNGYVFITRCRDCQKILKREARRPMSAGASSQLGPEMEATAQSDQSTDDYAEFQQFKKFQAMLRRERRG